MLKATSTYNKTLISDIQLFKGEKDNPFLAPRGVYICQGKLLVADTGQNRVFIWNQIPDESWKKPDITLGQPHASGTARNSGGKASASTLLYPSGIWTDGKKLIIADAWNHRVLIWLDFPHEDGQAADIVIGQKDFSSTEPNVEGIAHPPSSQSLNWPYGVYSDGNALWIADTGNRRVLWYKKMPTSSFQAADGVIGQETFHERDYDSRHAVWPYSVKISEKGEMAITDTQYYRILLWHDWRNGLSKQADVIIGQATFEANGQNQFGWFPDSNTLNWCYDTCFYKSGLWVADTGNSRILWHPDIPRKHNAHATALLGQEDFNTGSENKNSIQSTENSYYWPFSICIEGNLLVAADTGNHRIILNTLRI